MLFTRCIILGLAALAATHPVHEEQGNLQAVKARPVRANTKRALEGYDPQLQAQGVYARAIERLKATFAAQRKDKGIPLDASAPCMMADGRIMKPDTLKVLIKDQRGNLNPYEAMIDEPYASDDTTSAILSREGGTRPFYAKGQYIRDGLGTVEASAAGVRTRANIQLINKSACKPTRDDAWADSWTSNAAGVYPRIRRGADEDPFGAGDLDFTALRGIRRSYWDHVVRLRLTFPGH